MINDSNYHSDIKRFFMEKTNNKSNSVVSSIKELEVLSNNENRV